VDGLGFEPIALFGFQDGENLFLKGERWDAPYLPMMVERQPFLIGVSGDQLMINIDLDHPRVSQFDGEAIFLPHGGNTEFLEQTNSLLFAIHQGLQSRPASWPRCWNTNCWKALCSTSNSTTVRRTAWSASTPSTKTACKA
jgi:hypothetical protein